MDRVAICSVDFCNDPKLSVDTTIPDSSINHLTLKNFFASTIPSTNADTSSSVL